MTPTQVFDALFKAYGYVVLGTDETFGPNHFIGEIRSENRSEPGAWLVTGESNFAEYKKQGESIGFRVEDCFEHYYAIVPVDSMAAKKHLSATETSDQKHELGSAPIEEKYADKMHALAHFLDIEFNGDARGAAREVGFVLLVFPYGESEGRCNYISNGAGRQDIVKLLREQANRFDKGTM